MQKINYLDFYLISPLLTLFLLSLIPLFSKTIRNKSDLGKKIILFLSLLAVGAAAVMSLATSSAYNEKAIYAFSQQLIFERVGLWLGLSGLAAALISLVFFNLDSKITIKKYSEFNFLILSSLAGLLLASWSQSLLVLFVSIELVSLPLYTNILLSRGASYSKESALKYFVLGGLSSALFLLGMTFVYGAGVSLYDGQVLVNIDLLSEASEALSSVPMYQVGVLFLLISAFFKLGIFPMHNWLPDVYQGAPSSLTFYMSTTIKILGLIFLFKLMQAGFFRHLSYVQVSTQWLLALTMLAGSFFALRQKSLKRLFAYSGLANSAYLLFPFLAYAYDGQGDLTSFFSYFFVYTFFMALAFGALIFLERKKGSEIFMEDLKGLGTRFKVEAALLSLSALALAGLPPFVGFAAKLFILESTLAAGFYWLAFWMLITSAVAMVYYLQIVAQIYLYKFDLKALVLWDQKEVKESRVGVFVILIAGLLSLVLFVLVPSY